MDLKESAILDDCVERHWYYRSKAAAMCRYINTLRPKLVLDVGAGSGFFTKYLLQHTHAAAGLCVDTGYSVDLDENYSGKVIRYRRTCSSVAADLVLLMDVLEHVPDDLGMLAEYVRLVPDGSHFLITVPACQWLWSDHDVFLQHHRRYNIEQLKTLVSNAGLCVESASYYFGFVLPLVALIRMTEGIRRGVNRTPRSHLQSHHWFTNTLLWLICSAELPLLHPNRFGGLTVFCLARKP
jgi:SAM-dependent methyltransferase